MQKKLIVVVLALIFCNIIFISIFHKDSHLITKNNYEDIVSVDYVILENGELGENLLTNPNINETCVVDGIIYDSGASEANSSLTYGVTYNWTLESKYEVSEFSFYYDIYVNDIYISTDSFEVSKVKKGKEQKIDGSFISNDLVLKVEMKMNSIEGIYYK